MRKLPSFTLAFVFLTATAFGVAAEISGNPSVSIGDEKLFLAHVEGGGTDLLLNEYVRNDQSLERWNILLAVRFLRSAKSVDDAVKEWKDYLAHEKGTVVSLVEVGASTANDRRFMVSIRPPDAGYFECHQMRFIRGPNKKGIIYWQLITRLDMKLKEDAGAELQAISKQAAIGKALSSIAIPLFEEMPKQPAEPASVTRGGSS